MEGNVTNIVLVILELSMLLTIGVVKIFILFLLYGTANLSLTQILVEMLIEILVIYSLLDRITFQTASNNYKINYRVENFVP